MAKEIVGIIPGRHVTVEFLCHGWIERAEGTVVIQHHFCATDLLTVVATGPEMSFLTYDTTVVRLLTPETPDGQAQIDLR